MNAIGANAILGECDSPLREYNSSDCHLVELFSLILPSLIVWGECDYGECYLGESHSPCFISALLILYIDKILEIRRITKKESHFRNSLYCGATRD